MVVAVPEAFPEYDVKETPGDAEQMSHHGFNQAAHLPGLPGQVTVVQVDDGGDEEPRQEGEDVGLGELTLTQSLLQPDMTVVPDTSPAGHHTRPWGVETGRHKYRHIEILTEITSSTNKLSFL